MNSEGPGGGGIPEAAAYVKALWCGRTRQV